MRMAFRRPSRYSIVLLFVALAVSVVAIAACSSPTPTPTPPPTATTAPKYPLTLTDVLGRQVQVAARPQRVVTLSPTATEMVHTVGGTIVGRDSSSTYPPEWQSLPTVGSAYGPNVESVIALKPDLVIVEAITQGRLIESLSKVGAPVMAVRAASLDDINKGLTLVGTALDQSNKATQAIASIKTRIDAAAASVPTSKKALILIYDADRNIYAAKPESYPGAVASMLKLTNLAAGLPDSGPFPGFTLFSGEKALSSNPDIIFAISPAPAPAPKLSQILVQVPGYKDLDAVKSGRVKEIDPTLFLSAQGPRIADAVEQMAKQVKEATP